MSETKLNELKLRKEVEYFFSEPRACNFIEWGECRQCHLVNIIMCVDARETDDKPKIVRYPKIDDTSTNIKGVNGMLIRFLYNLNICSPLCWFQLDPYVRNKYYNCAEKGVKKELDKIK